MTWCNNESSDEEELNDNNSNSKVINIMNNSNIDEASGGNEEVGAIIKPSEIRTITCPSCGHNIQVQEQVCTYGFLLHIFASYSYVFLKFITLAT